MGKFSDRTGQRFGRWLVLSFEGQGKWLCLCDCGNERSVLIKNLINGRSQSCGCLGSERSHEPRPSRSIDETGNRYGRLLVLERGEGDPANGVSWLCQCDCGKITTVLGKSLRKGLTVSCGCWRKEKATERIQAISRAQLKEKHPRWKGEDVSYRYAHVWVSRQKDKTGICFQCGAERYTEWANIHPEREHSRNLDDYQEFCKPCHMRLDGHPWVGRAKKKRREKPIVCSYCGTEDAIAMSLNGPICNTCSYKPENMNPV